MARSNINQYNVLNQTTRKYNTKECINQYDRMIDFINN